MKSEKEELMKMRYLYILKNSSNLGLVNNDIDFKNNYFKDLAKHETMSAYSGWSPDYRDIATFFEIFLADNSFNYGLYDNPEFNALYKQAQAETDMNARWNLFKQAEEVFLNDAVFVPLLQRGKRYLVKPKVQGFNFNSISPEIDYRFISIK